MFGFYVFHFLALTPTCSQDNVKDNNFQIEKVFSEPTLVISKGQELASISSISAATLTKNTTTNTTSIIQCNETWKNMHQNAIAEKESNQKKIENYVKEHLFRKLKFFNLELMLYDTKELSVCQKVCNALKIAETERKRFWSTYSACVKKAIKVARNDAIQAMKLSFFKGTVLQSWLKFIQIFC